MSAATDETGMWLRDLEKKEKEEIASAKSSDLPDWLSGIDTETQVESIGDQQNQHDDKPSWLSEDSKTASSFEEKLPVAQSADSDLPNWLNGIEEESTAQDSFSDTSLANNDLSNWLSGLDDEPGLPFDALPTPDSILAAKSAQEIAASKSQKAKDENSDSDLPAWLNGVDSQQEDQEEDLWKKPIMQESIPSASTRTEEELALLSQIAEELPDWLQEADVKTEEIEETADGGDTPPWLEREKWEAAGAQQPKPTSPSDWHPIATEAVQKPVEVEPPQPIVSKKKSSQPAKPRSVEAQTGPTILNQAKGELDRGDIPAALDHYGKLIKKGKHLEETIRDLTESLYRYPVEVGIWQTLGDAYMRANRLKEALESYNKAEELIR
jgi:tetratricopeptide (TPR) repeat protein